MRLLHTFKNDQDARTFSSFLTQNEIENQLDITPNTDWGSPDYGIVTCKIWIIEEDDTEAAEKWLELFLQNPSDPMFVHLKPTEPMIFQSFPGEDEQKQQEIKPRPTQAPPPPPQQKPKTMGIITLYLLLGCTILYFITATTTRYPETIPQNVPLTPLYASPFSKAMYYDYPHAYEIIDKIINAYGADSLINLSDLPPEGRYLLRQYSTTPFWTGIYRKVVDLLHSGTPLKFDAPMFEKVQKGELWRLFSPCLLHNDLFHLFFNMIWLFVMGQQIERRIGALKYLFFIIATGIFSNTAQYLISGASFIGFSGVLCAMIAFVWFRQRKAPWEGYQLLPATMTFVTVFVLAMAGIQVASFFLEILGQSSIAPAIANTAHLSGGLAG
ncbi:MAG: Rhomboid protease GlpG, partial [Chlamydiae bacterium]|nr:Rhomboid protease GlpG [Chlamydiota bacterium]